MLALRTVRTVLAVPVAVATAALALATLAPAADAPTPTPVVRLSATVTPDRLPIPPGTPLALTLDTRFSSVPPGGNFVLQRAEFLFGGGSRINTSLFPSCSVAKLAAAHGRLSACPEGSKIGTGYAAGRAISVGISSRARITVFNGPGGHSVTMNASVVRPVLINKTISIPITRLHGRYTMKISSTLPDEFKRVLDGDIVVSRIYLETGATRMIHGVRRGYFEATHCPRGGSRIHGDFTFNQDRAASADLVVIC